MTEEFVPLATAQIPAPVLEDIPGNGGIEEGLPRILRQAAEGRRAARRLLLLAGLFGGLAALEGVLYRSGLSGPRHLEVYGVRARPVLVGTLR